MKSTPRIGFGLSAMAIAVVGWLSAAPSFAQELIMFEEIGCPWCARWTEEIGPAYPKTAEGKRAPLRRVDMHAERPTDLREIGRINFSPTFVLFHDGAEIGRIEGYPGEDFFWPMLEDLVAQLPEPETNEKDDTEELLQ